MEQVKKQDTNFSLDRTELEKTIWSFIKDNIQRTYETELIWIQDQRRAVENIPNENDVAENAHVKAEKMMYLDYL